MAKLTAAYWAIISTLASVALSFGHYESRTFADVMWGFTAALWLMWLVHVTAHGVNNMFSSADEKLRHHRLDHYRRVSEFQVQAEVMLLESLIAEKHRQRPGQWRDPDPKRTAADGWQKTVSHYLRTQVSTTSADDFTQAATKPLSQGLITTAEALAKRIEVLKDLRDELYESALE
jgi:hypothetical protein